MLGQTSSANDLETASASAHAGMLWASAPWARTLLEDALRLALVACFGQRSDANTFGDCGRCVVKEDMVKALCIVAEWQLWPLLLQLEIPLFLRNHSTVFCTHCNLLFCTFVSEHAGWGNASSKCCACAMNAAATMHTFVGNVPLHQSVCNLLQMSS